MQLGAKIFLSVFLAMAAVSLTDFPLRDSIGLSALAAFVLARALSQPIRVLVRGTGELARGCYSTRIDPGGPDELGQLARNFNRLAETLEAEKRSRQQWVADTSHELRTPLGVLRAELEAIQDGLRRPDPPTLTALLSEVERLHRLVEALSELARSDQGFGYQLRPVDLNGLLEEAMSAFAGRFQEHGLGLAQQLPNLPCWVNGDAGKLGQTVENILENSLRYTDRGGSLRLCLEGEKEEWVVTFSDSSPGVSRTAMDRLFERFYRDESSRSRETGGSGLGLAVCLSIVRAHGGSLSARSSDLGGLTLEMRLPRG